MSKRLLLTLFGLLALIVPGAALAQDGEGEPPTLLLCENGAGCRHAKMSGKMSQEDLELLMGEEDPHGKNIVICHDSGCDWSALSEEDADLAAGGDGEVPMTFTVEEVYGEDTEEEMTFTEEEAEQLEEESEEAESDDADAEDSEVEDEDESMNFTIDEVTPSNVVPMGGQWTAYHSPGIMDCGVMTMDIPGGDVQTGNVQVSEDGSTITATGLDADATTLPMNRIAGGVYHAQLEITVEGSTATIDFYIVFVDEGLGVGYIEGKAAAQGVECLIQRWFQVLHGEVDLMRDEVLPPEDETIDEDTPVS
jgi:hypothetical protein